MQERRIVRITGSDGSVASPAVTAGGLIFVSALLPIGENGKMLAADVQAQTRRVLARLRDVLEAAGSSIAQAVSIHVYLREATDFDAMNTAYRETFADKPPVRTTVAVELKSGAQVMISAIAVPNGAPREVMHPAGWVKSPRPYSYIVKAAGLVFFSGLVSRRGADDVVVPGPVALQTTTILDNASVLLKTAGLSFSDVACARVFVTDDSYFEAMNDVYRRYFTSEPPARATAVTGLMGNDAAVEISLIASANGKQVIGPAVAPSLPLSTAARAGDFLFLSGVLGNTDANASDLTSQTTEVFSRIRRTLDGLGLSFDHVVENLVYTTDLWQQHTVDDLSRSAFPTDPPARTMVGAKLVTRTGLIEMMMTAVGR